MRWPPMPAFTTETRFQYAACRRRERSSGQRSSPLIVEAAPSVIESPNAQTTRVTAGATTSIPSRKYHEVVEKGNAASLAFPATEGEPGRLTYDVCSAFACHVIGPLVPAM